MEMEYIDSQGSVLDHHVVIIILVDMEKSYDTVPLKKPFEIITKFGLSKKKLMFAPSGTYLKSLVRVGNVLAERFHASKGLKRGCSLLPT